MACTLSNKCAKNLSKRTVLLQLIIKNVVTHMFFGTQCRRFSIFWLETCESEISVRIESRIESVATIRIRIESRISFNVKFLLIAI